MKFRNDVSQQKYAVGQSIPRTEDPVLLNGTGRFTDDISLPDQTYMTMVRSTVAHGIIRNIDISNAVKMPGVLLILTGEQLKDYDGLPCTMQIKNRDGTPLKKPKRPSLVLDKVRFVGDPVACVIAKTVNQAKDASEAILLEIDEIPSVTEARAASAPEAPTIYDEIPDNIALDFHFGDSTKVDEAFANAIHVTRLDIRNNRIVVAAMEPRSALADYDTTSGRYTMRMGCQGTFGMRRQLANLLRVDQSKVRVLTGNVGGSFGMKSFVYPEYICLLHATKVLGKPVKWTEDRANSFLSDQQGRDHQTVGELALAANGEFLAVRLSIHANLGAYMAAVGPNISTNNAVKNIVSVYKTPLIEVNTKCVFTNTTPVSAYRGAGRPEANYYMERLIDTAARDLKIDRIKLREINHILPDQIPYTAPSGQLYDSGDFPSVLNHGLNSAKWDGFKERRAKSLSKGLLRGIGISNYLEVTAPVETEMGGIRFDDDGGVTIITGTLDYGQGHAAPFAQILQTHLGIPFSKIRLLQGDSDDLITGGGTGGSKSIMASGGAILEASQQVIKKAKKAASYLLEAAEEDIEFSNGSMRVVGTDLKISVLDIAVQLRKNASLPKYLPENLNVQIDHGGVPSTYPNGCHICEVEIDPETGKTAVSRYSMVNDFGVLINPLLVEGQCHGGVVQGLGQALFENVVYDISGQPLSGSFMDYALPRAIDVPLFSFKSYPVPAKTNALGAKGCGEAGCAGALPAVMNAVVDALSEYGINHINMPVTSESVWKTIQMAKANKLKS